MQINQGVSYQSLKKYQEAIDCYQKALTIQHNVPNAENNLLEVKNMLEVSNINTKIDIFQQNNEEEQKRSSEKLQNIKLIPLTIQQFIKKYTYEIDQVLGTGGQAIVYSGCQLENINDVAIKIIQYISPKCFKIVEEQIQIHLEAQYDTDLIVKILDYAIEEKIEILNQSKYYTVIQALEKGAYSLESYINKINIIDDNELLLFVKNIIAIGCHLEKKNIAHLDLKSSNFLLFPQKKIKLIDFGINKKSNVVDLTDISEETKQKLTETTLMGISIDWAAPEIKKIFTDQQAKKEFLSSKSNRNEKLLKADIYSAGLIILQLATMEKKWDQLQSANVRLTKYFSLNAF